MKIFLCVFLGIPAAVASVYGVLLVGSWLTQNGYEWVNWVALWTLASLLITGVLTSED